MMDWARDLPELVPLMYPPVDGHDALTEMPSVNDAMSLVGLDGDSRALLMLLAYVMRETEPARREEMVRALAWVLQGWLKLLQSADFQAAEE